MDLELARHYRDVYFTFTIGAQPANPIIDELLPALFLLRIVSVVDDAMGNYQSASAGPTSRAAPGSLYGRIESLRAAGILSGADDLNRLRERRNQVAHELQHSVKWSDIEYAVEVVHRALQELAFVTDRPSFEFYAVREAAENSNEPGIMMTQRCYYGLKRDGRKAIEVAWTTKFHDESASGGGA